MQNVDAAGLGIGDDHPPRIMGVLNVSEESPYDPSVFDDPGEAAGYVDDELIDEGADIVDVGLESANKKFDVLSAAQELDRLDTAVETLESTSGDAVWSIETRYAEVAEAALDRGFDMVNDIAGFADPEMPAVCREYDVAVAKMASPPDITKPGAVRATPWAERRSAEWAEGADYVDQVYEALQQNGLTDKTIVDPAFGRWSEDQTIEDDRDTFRRLREFRGLGAPTLVSINRKTFLRSLADRSTEGALPVSLAATSMAVERGAHVIRTHDVSETRDAALVGDAFAGERARSAGGDGELSAEELDVTTPGEAARHFERAGVAADPAAAVGRLYAVGGLDESAREALRSAAAATDCRFVAGDEEGFLWGSAGALADLATRTDVPRALAGTLPGDGQGDR
ncbi:dihydropteroate synthase [Halosimplex carlsbadense 2-9-1]|uniref:dihydropteroate synthase n=1 Tax=Halosimplex carlsbadense 2-9-1 TaxID=797114 RepID=M0CZY7_9EURY|nr:dihydropteroate synthase [Halosimplex carlsbadense]ELZ27449.1 dihydropteroate synthase [Halosimplex carlsbadense 2-9-1]